MTTTTDNYISKLIGQYKINFYKLSFFIYLNLQSSQIN